MARADISSMRGDQPWTEICCDEPRCDATVEAPHGEQPDGWTRDLTAPVLTTASAKDYCPAHSST